MLATVNLKRGYVARDQLKKRDEAEIPASLINANNQIDFSIYALGKSTLQRTLNK
jgi:hypothetical protein